MGEEVIRSYRRLTALAITDYCPLSSVPSGPACSRPRYGPHLRPRQSILHLAKTPLTTRLLNFESTRCGFRGAGTESDSPAHLRHKLPTSPILETRQRDAPRRHRVRATEQLTQAGPTLRPE